MAEPGFLKMSEERSEKPCTGFAPCFGGVATHSHPRFNKRSDEPGPDRALMIRAVALHYASLVMLRVIRFPRRERTQAQWRQQSRFNQRDDLFCALVLQEL